MKIKRPLAFFGALLMLVIWSGDSIYNGANVDKTAVIILAVSSMLDAVLYGDDE